MEIDYQAAYGSMSLISLRFERVIDDAIDFLEDGEVDAALAALRWVREEAPALICKSTLDAVVREE